MNFNIMIDGRVQVGIGFEVIQKAIVELYDDVDSFIVLEPSLPIQGSVYLQTAIDDNNYMIETRLMADSHFTHYRYITADINEVFKIYTHYYQKHKLVTLEYWQDVTDEF